MAVRYFPVRDKGYSVAVDFGGADPPTSLEFWLCHSDKPERTIVRSRHVISLRDEFKPQDDRAVCAVRDFLVEWCADPQNLPKNPGNFLVWEAWVERVLVKLTDIYTGWVRGWVACCDDACSGIACHTGKMAGAMHHWIIASDLDIHGACMGRAEIYMWEDFNSAWVSGAKRRLWGSFTADRETATKVLERFRLYPDYLKLDPSAAQWLFFAFLIELQTPSANIAQTLSADLNP